jgi:hypothetical protein
MPKVHSIIQDVFGRFQNLNLLVLLDDLRRERTTQGAWATADDLCPVAHGMPAGQVVSDLRYLGQTAEVERACDYAARHLGADFCSVCQFVEFWDAAILSPCWLLEQLGNLWTERLADADAVQQVLNPTSPTVEENSRLVFSLN